MSLFLNTVFLDVKKKQCQNSDIIRHCIVLSGTSRTSAACTRLWSWMRWWLTSHRGLSWSCSTCLDHQRTEEEMKTVSFNPGLLSHNNLVIDKKINKLVTFTVTNRDVAVLFVEVIICSSPWLCPQIWSSLKSSWRVWTGSSWSEAGAVKSLPFILKEGKSSILHTWLLPWIPIAGHFCGKKPNLIWFCCF